VVDGQKRSSIVIDPPNGRVPAAKPEARRRALSLIARPTSDAQESNDPGLEPPGSYDDPERRPLGERCLLGFGSTSGPPALPDYFYNNLHQIVQTRDAVMILTEMVHDVRVVRMNARHLPKTIRKWMGDSVGRWEGDTLVIDTANFNGKTWLNQNGEMVSHAEHVVERLTPVDGDTIMYEATVTDPIVYTRPFTIRFPLRRQAGELLEVACHEDDVDLEHLKAIKDAAIAAGSVQR
jgi:hypothetical protein